MKKFAVKKMKTSEPFWKHQEYNKFLKIHAYEAAFERLQSVIMKVYQTQMWIYSIQTNKIIIRQYPWND